MIKNLIIKQFSSNFVKENNVFPIVLLRKANVTRTNVKAKAHCGVMTVTTLGVLVGKPFYSEECRITRWRWRNRIRNKTDNTKEHTSLDIHICHVAATVNLWSDQ